MAESELLAPPVAGDPAHPLQPVAAAGGAAGAAGVANAPPPAPGVHAEVTPAQVLRQFRQVFSAVRNHFHQLEKLAGVGGAQVWAMSEIRQTPGMGMNALARAMDVHQSTASNLVRQLVQRGLVHTEKSTLDRRGVCLYLTADAQALLAQVPGPHQGLLPQALAQLSPQALQQLSQGLGELVGGLAVDEAAARTPLANL